MKVDPRFLCEEGLEVFTGNELLLKGALETEGGVHLLGGYPGSPVAGFFDSMSYIGGLLNDKGIRACISNNEALAAAMLNGTQVAGVRGMIVMKSVGVHVAADALALGSLAGAHRDGGAIVVYGDDPWSDSTQVPSDSRFLSRHLYIPVFEPANAQEVKDYVDLAFRISREAEIYAGFLLPTNLADGGGTVRCRPNHYPKVNTHQQKLIETKAIDLDKFVLLPPRTWWQEENFPRRHARAVAMARELGINRIDPPRGEGRHAVGFVSSGMAYGYLRHALAEMGLEGAFPILKFGISYPIDAEMVGELAQQCDRIVVVEERRAFLEEQVRGALDRARQQGLSWGKVELWGKSFPGGLAGFPDILGLHPSMVVATLMPLIERLRGEGQLVVPDNWVALRQEAEALATSNRSPAPNPPKRLPSFCPGCPHRDTASICLDVRRKFMNPHYMKTRHKRGVVDLVFHGDTGCYTMLMFPPNKELMHNYSGMGLGGGTGAGMDPFIRNKQVVFMGDSTFFHSGSLAISQAVKLGQDITFILLDNRTTAMTGHQPLPSVDYDIIGNRTPMLDIDEIIRSMGPVGGQLAVVRANPEQKEYRQLLEETFLADGVKVIIADKECGITRIRRKRREERDTVKRKGYLPRREYMNVNTEICRYCLACAEITGCPGLRHVETDYGRKVDTDLSTCVNDGACERIGACSSFERVTVHRRQPARSRVPELGLDRIPEPERIEVTDVWRACLTGVGGMGIGLATSILVRAGAKEGHHVVFLDKKGLAIRNGGIISQVVYHRDPDRATTALIPYGKADLLLGVDVLEAARSLDPAGRVRIGSPARTAAVINTTRVQTIEGIMGQSEFDMDELLETIRSNSRPDTFLAHEIGRICEQYLGSRLYSNVMMLGFAYQRGLIPVSLHSMAWAIKDAVPPDFKENLYAFNMGRKFVLDRGLFQGAPQRTAWRETLDERCRFIIRRYRNGQDLADRLRELLSEAMDRMSALDDTHQRAIVVRAYDALRWGGLGHARRYVEQVEGIYARDRQEFGHAATQAAIHNLARAMLIKDGIYIAELSTSPEKHARDRAKYNVNPANGDRLTYRHLFNPQWKVFGRTYKPDISVPHWSLQVLKRMRWLRKLLPTWHGFERQYLQRYEQTLAAFEYSSYDQYRQQVARLSMSQCMGCLTPRCQDAGCPLNNRIPEWMALVDAGKWEQASQVLHETNNFPEFTGAVCPAFCQEACKKGVVGYPVQVQDVERQIVERAWAEGWLTPATPEVRSGRRVAVVGSGPAGLAAAQQLARAGHDVTVFEKDDRPGGLLRYGIPEHRLGSDLVDRRIAQLEAEGVKFRTGVSIGDNVGGQELRGQFDAVLLAAGANIPRDLAVPGRDVAGVHFALDYLRVDEGAAAGNGHATIDVRDKVVAVIGGGLTGQDCVEKALAAGASQVHQIEILPRHYVRTEPLDLGLRDRVRQRFGVATKAFEANGRNDLSTVRAVEVDWHHSPKGLVMQEKPDTEFAVRADVALLALGFEPRVHDALASELGLELDASGRLRLDGFATNVPGVFAAGDLVTGPAYVATAIDSGRKAARALDRYLSDEARTTAAAE